MSGRGAAPSSVLNTFVLIKPLPLTKKQPKVDQESKHKFSVKNASVDPHSLSDYAIKKFSYVDHSNDHLTKSGSKDDDEVQADGSSGFGEQKAKKKKKKNASTVEEDPDFAQYCSNKFIVIDDKLANDQKDLTIEDFGMNGALAGPSDDSSLLESTDDVVFSNEMTTSTQKCTFDLSNEKRLLQVLADALQFKFDMENAFFQNEYMIKFNVNITFPVDFTYERFPIFVEKLFENLPKDQKLIIEMPLDVITRLNKSLANCNRSYNYYRVGIINFSMGSLVNLSKYFMHFSIRSHVKPTPINVLQVEIKIPKKSLTIYFNLDSKTRVHKLVYSFSIIKQIVLEKITNVYRVYFDLNSAPLLFYADIDENANKQKGMKGRESNVADLRLHWLRTTTFQLATPDAQRHDGGGKQQLSHFFCQSTESCLLGMCKSFCFELGFEKEHTRMLQKLISIAHFCKSMNKNFNFYLTSVTQSRASIDYRNANILLNELKLPFSIFYACLVLFNDSYAVLDGLKSDNQLDTFLGAVKEEANVNSDALEQCLYFLKVQCKEMSIVNVYNEFMKLLDNRSLMDKSQGSSMNDYVLIRRAMLTPAHLELMQPIPLLKSRFSTMANIDFALRLTILDDNNRKLNNCKNAEDTHFVKGIIKCYLLDGVKIGDREYHFLGSSSSQMRENGVIIYAKDREGRTAQMIRDLAGDLSSFKRNVAKYVARFGLMFSQAMTIIEIPEKQVKVFITNDFLGDVKPNFENFVNQKQDKHILSDGVGIIARSVAMSTVLPQLTQLRATDYFPSAFQIRYGGCKGMLVVYDTAQPAIVFRKSMKKYDSPDNSLGILKYSLPRPVFLNRPLINILDQLKVDRDEFYHYFEESTSLVAKALLYDSCALELVKTYAHSYLPYTRILSSGVSLLEEPFLRSIIDYLIFYRLYELKSRARIRIPLTNGRMAFGVIDETRTLNYGEIYFQYTKIEKDGSISNETVILEGEVMVTKFPCLQPGDVRKLKAVKVESLSHIKDCIVFPSKGARPHPDEMGGSDLDGDEYAIFSDPKIMFPDTNFDSMTFPYGLAKENTSDITITDIVEFYCNYLLLNNIGQVANTHLIFSDYHTKGLFSKECHDLAIMYSISLDYQKTGIIKEFPSKYFLNIRPDFMERFGTDKVYLSKRILGQFYRHCSLIERIVGLSKFDTTTSNASLFCKNPKLILPGWKKFYSEAEKTFLKYKLKIVEIMEQLNIDSEVVLFSDVYEDKSDASRVLVRSMFDYFQYKFNEQAKSFTEPVDRYLLISSWYAICYEKNYTYNGKPILGLPWLVADEVCQLAVYSSLKGDHPDELGASTQQSKQMRMVITSEGDQLFEVQMGNNDKQVVPYKLAKAIRDTLFDRKTLTVYGIDVTHNYWSPFKMINSCKDHCPHLIPFIYRFLEEAQFKLVMCMLMQFVDMLKQEVYKEAKNEHKFIKVDSQKKMLEKDLLYQSLSKKLEEIVQSCGRQTSQDIELLPTISTLFNRMLYYLFDICNRVNSIIFHSNMEELFLIKYAVFALSFIDKIDIKMDRKFYTASNFSDKYLQNWQAIASIYERQQAGENWSSELLFQPNGMFADYEAFLRELFNSYLLDNNFLTVESISFFLPPMDNRMDLLAERHILIPKLRHLSGVTDIQLFPNTDNTWGRNDNADDEDEDELEPVPNALNGEEQPKEESSSKELTRFVGNLNQKSAALRKVAYEVKTTGLVHSTQILRLLIGHPDFFSKMYPFFSI